MPKTKLIAALALGIVLNSGARAATAPASPADFGTAATESVTGRIIRITPTTKFVHVDNGEAVTFEVKGKRFGWHVYTYPNVGEFRLRQIAPAGVDVDAVRVIVAPNPIYFGG